MTEKQIEAKVKSLMEAEGIDADTAIDRVLDEIKNGPAKELSLAERIALKAKGNVATSPAPGTVKATSKVVPVVKAKAKTRLEIADEAFETMPETITVTLYKYTFSTESKGYRTPENVMVADEDGNEFALAKANLVILDTRRK